MFMRDSLLKARRARDRHSKVDLDFIEENMSSAWRKKAPTWVLSVFSGPLKAAAF